MKKRPKDPDREDRIHNEAIVDAYGPQEQAISWYYYLENRSTSRSTQSASPLKRPRHCGKEKWLKSAAWLLKTPAPAICSCSSDGKAGIWPFRSLS